MLLQIKRIRGKFEPIVSFNNILSHIYTYFLFVFHMTHLHWLSFLKCTWLNYLPLSALEYHFGFAISDCRLIAAWHLGLLLVHRYRKWPWTSPLMPLVTFCVRSEITEETSPSRKGIATCGADVVNRGWWGTDWVGVTYKTIFLGCLRTNFFCSLNSYIERSWDNSLPALRLYVNATVTQKEKPIKLSSG